MKILFIIMNAKLYLKNTVYGILELTVVNENSRL